MSIVTVYNLPIFHRLRIQFTSLLRQGLSPQALAATLALGTVLGTLPVVWGTTLLCVLTAAVLRLNQVAIQAVNYLVWPLQLAMLLPFFHIGKRLLPSLAPGLDGAQFLTLLQTDPLESAATLGSANLLALLGWLCLAPLAGILLYAVLRVVLPRVIKRFI